MLVTTEKQYAIVIKGKLDIIIDNDALPTALNNFGIRRTGLDDYETGVLPVVNVTPDVGTGEYHVQHGVKSSKISKLTHAEYPDALPQTVMEVEYYSDIHTYNIMAAVLALYDKAISDIEGNAEASAKYRTGKEAARNYLANDKDTHALSVLKRMLGIGDRKAKFSTPTKLAKFIVALWARRDHLIIAKDEFYKEATTTLFTDNIYTYDDVQALLAEHADIIANIK